MTHYIHDEKNNRIEGMSKEEIYALLADAIQTGQLPSVDEDTAFVTMFKSIVDGKTYKMAFCTQAQYNQLEAQGLLVADAYYIITDDTTYDDIIAYIDNKETSLLENISTKVPINFNNGQIENNIISNGNGLMLTIDDIDGDSNSTATINNGGVSFYASATDAQSTLNVGQGVLSISTAEDDNGVQINISSYDAVISRTVDGDYETKSLFDLKEKEKILYTNTNNYNLTPSNWVTLNLSETITNTSILELYATLRINDNTVYTKFNGKVQLSSNLFTDVFISFPMFNYGAGSGQAIGMVVIYVKYITPTSVQVKLDTLGIANSSIFVNSLPSSFNAKIDKILLIEK